MIAKDLIDFNIPFLKIDDKSSKALDLMREFECTRLPVVSDGHYAGFLDESMIINYESQNINDFNLLGENGIVYQTSHYYDIINFLCSLTFLFPYY